MARTSAIGLDIGTSGVRAAQLSVGRGGVSLRRYGSVPLPEGAVRDGEVVDPVAVAAALRQLWAATKFGSRQVVLGVANHRVIVRQVDVPAVPLADLPAALPFQVQDLLPMPVESAVLDFHLLEEVTGPSGEPVLRGLLVAAARDMLTQTISCVESAGLSVASVDLTSFAVLRALGTRLDADVRAEALVDIGADVTNVVVHCAGVPRFVRILLRGGHDVTDAIAEDLGVSLGEAEMHKLTAWTRHTAFADPVAAVVEGAGALVEELRGSLDYYASAHPEEPIDRIVLSGGGSLLAGFAEQLTAVTRIPVVAADPLAAFSVDGADVASTRLTALSSRAAVPVGLALGSTR